MFCFETPYLDMYRTLRIKRTAKPNILHRQTCPNCKKTLVNLYYSNELNKHVCKQCMDVILKGISKV